MQCSDWLLELDTIKKKMGTTQTDDGFTLYSKRWSLLFGYAILSLLNAVMWITFAAIDDATAVFFNCSINDVNMLALVFQILYFPGFLFALYLVEASSLRFALVVASGMGAMGCMFRALAGFVAIGSPSTAYWLCMVGQCLGALSQPIFLSTAAVVAGNWFPVSERDVAVTVGSLFNPLGNAVGQVIPPFLVVTGADDDDFTAENVRSGMQRLLVGEAVALTLGFVWCLCVFKSHPPTPPSQSAFNRLEARTKRINLAHGIKTTDADTKEQLTGHHDDEEEESGIQESSSEVFHELIQNFKLLLSNQSFLLLLVGFSIGLAIFNALLTLIAQWLKPYGYSNDEAGLAGGSLIMCGLIGAACAALLLDSYHCFREVLKGSFCCAFLTLIGLTWCLQTGSVALLLVGSGVLGFFCLPILPGVIENAVETTYPIPEEASSGLLFACGNVVGIAFTEILAKLVKSGNETYFAPSNLFLQGSLLVAILFILPYNGEYKRLAAEKGGVGPTLNSPLINDDVYEDPPPPPGNYEGGYPSPATSTHSQSSYVQLEV